MPGSSPVFSRNADAYLPKAIPSGFARRRRGKKDMNAKTYFEYSRYGSPAGEGAYAGSHPGFDETVVHIMHMSQICSLAANYFNRNHNGITGRGKEGPGFPGRELESLLVDGDGYINAKRLFAATLLHDIGKEEVPIGILTATGFLSQDERQLMSDHTRKGERMLAALLGDSPTEDAGGLRAMIAERYPFVTQLTDDDLNAARYIAKYHHETADGGGYEKVRATPLLQLVGLADSYQATRMKRTYHDRNSLEATRQIILSRTGAVPHDGRTRPPAFDADVAEAFFEDGLQQQVQKTFEPVYEYLTSSESINTDTMMAISSFTKDYPGQCRYIDGRETGYGPGTGFVMCGNSVVALISSGQLIAGVRGGETISGITARVNECYREACRREYGMVDAEFPYEDYEFMRYSTSKGRHSLRMSRELSGKAGPGDTIDDARRNLAELHQIRQAAKTAYMMGLSCMGDRLSLAEVSLRELLMYRDSVNTQLNGTEARGGLTGDRLGELLGDIHLLAELSTAFIISVSDSAEEQDTDVFRDVERFVTEERQKGYSEAARDLMKPDYRKAQGDLGRYLRELSERAAEGAGQEQPADMPGGTEERAGCIGEE